MLIGKKLRQFEDVSLDKYTQARNEVLGTLLSDTNCYRSVFDVRLRCCEVFVIFKESHGYALGRRYHRTIYDFILLGYSVVKSNVTIYNAV